MNLKTTDLRGADLRGVDLRGADLRGRNLSGAILGPSAAEWNKGLDEDYVVSAANLKGANLSKANLKGVKAMNATFDDCDLRGANLEGADLQHATFRRADLRGANLMGATLFCDFIDAQLDGKTKYLQSQMEGSRMPNGTISRSLTYGRDY